MKKRNWRLMLRRVLNLVFSRLVITVTLVLLQVFWLFSVFHWLDAYSTWLNGVGLALSVIMCLALIRQDSTAPEFKISWMIIFMLMPVQGGLLYLLWGNKRPALGLRHRLERAETAMPTPGARTLPLWPPCGSRTPARPRQRAICTTTPPRRCAGTQR